MVHRLSARRSRVGALLIVLGVVGATLAIMPAAGATDPVANPPLGQSCGLDIALVLDVSGSIGSTELSQMKAAFVGFVNAFLPATPTQFSVTKFDDTASVLLGFSADIAAITAAINGASGGGLTNWEAGLASAYSTFAAGRADKPDLMIFASDGYPNVGGDYVAQANIIKGAGIRIITLGIGTGVGAAALQSISSADAYYSGDFATLAATLAGIADDLCGGTITVQKLMDPDGDLGTTGGREPGEGWFITIDDGNTETSPIIKQTAADGYTNPWQAPAGTTGTYSVIETLESGFSLLSASCTGATNNGSFSAGSLGVTGVVMDSNDIVSCTFINTEAHAALKLVKHVINHGGVADAWDFYLSATNNADAAISLEGYGAVSGGLPAGVYTLAETGPELYEPGDWACSGDGFQQAGDQLTLSAGASVQCDITNEQGVGHIVVRKAVPADAPAASFAFGSTYAGSFALAGGASTGAIEVYAGAHSVTEFLSAEQVAAGWALGSAYCNDGSAVSAIGVSPGETVTCTFENVYQAAPGHLQVVKVVDGGDAVCSDFSFSVDGGDPIAFEDDCANEVELLAGSHHSVAEPAVADYVTSYDNCSDVEIVPGAIATCTITNKFEEETIGPEGSLTIIKETVPAGGAGFSFDGGALGAFTLDDGGSQVFTELAAGAYTVAEAAHADYAFAEVSCEAADWVADGSSVTVNLAEGEAAVCTFTNGELPYTGSNGLTMPVLIAGLWAVLMGLGMLVWGRMRKLDLS